MMWEKNLAPFFVSITIRAVSNKSEFRMDYNLAFCPGMLINAYFLNKKEIGNIQSGVLATINEHRCLIPST